jgi:hypothetical protein
VTFRFRACSWITGIAILATAAPARADLTGDVDRLARFWTDRGARVERLPPVFLEHGRSRTLAIAKRREGDPGCLAVAIVGVRTADFFVARDDRAVDPAAPPDPPPRPGDPPADNRLRSAGGAVSIAACGAERDRLDRLRIEMGSARATLEIVTVRSESPARALREILPERAAGPLAPRGDPGVPLEPGPLAERLARAERRAREDGAAQVDRTAGRAQPNGTGRFDADLAPGCHRLEVLADVPAVFPHRATDVDAEARDHGGHVLARDRAEVPDARLDVCVGEITPVAIPFAGVAGPVPVTLVHAAWPVPARVPSRWGPRARAGFASALARRRAPDPPEPAIVEAVGVQGLTSIPFAVQPDHCYLAALAMVRGETRLIRLSATTAGRTVRDDVTDHPESASVSFCADHDGVAHLDADLRGGAGTWALAVWPMGAATP